MVLVAVILWLIVASMALWGFILCGLLTLLHFLVPFALVIAAVTPACSLAALFLVATYSFKRVGLIGNPVACVGLYVVYIVLIYLVTIGCFEAFRLGLLSKSALTWATIVVVAIVMPMALRTELESIGLNDECDRWFTLVCCFAALLVVLFEPETKPLIEAFSLTLSIGSFAGASSFLVKKIALWNDRRNEENRERKGW